MAYQIAPPSAAELSCEGCRFGWPEVLWVFRGHVVHWTDASGCVRMRFDYFVSSLVSGLRAPLGVTSVVGTVGGKQRAF